MQDLAQIACESREDGFCEPPRCVGKEYMLWWWLKMQGDEYPPHERSVPHRRTDPEARDKS
jgi:hypothetical protein